ncbi:pirin family protein [Roseofilum casamattae]|uniref:Pirin family protein n=1 Tax=Roseofilum casamattae BLCC-M143 TaxID=3022442 RepID=A0ABT7BTQ6_9CYAN|nr:pirin family protein [Roseofilum casamattae]MDJ1182566.1 pirin family protein [Roseofilum casamattae BLCC-M143]
MANTALKTPEITVRKAAERGHAHHGWLNSYHTFSFASYYDPNYQGFRHLRVINEDRITGGSGFGTHSHRDMEIISYVIEGALEHKDSMGNVAVISPGEVQIMSAGEGVTHSEYNHSQTDLAHFLQIWILPDRKNLTPGYQQQYFAPEAKQDRLKLLVSPDGQEGSVIVHQNMRLYGSVLEAGKSVTHNLESDRYGWLQVVRGSLSVNGIELETSDGAAISGVETLELESQTSAEFLLFDLA